MTRTTKSRMNALLARFLLGGISQRNFCWYLNSEPYVNGTELRIPSWLF